MNLLKEIPELLNAGVITPDTAEKIQEYYRIKNRGSANRLFIVFVIGILTVREGAKQNHLGILNFGLLVITALVICRFFDTDLSFVFRGILFVSVGAGFFATNYIMLKKRKAYE